MCLKGMCLRVLMSVGEELCVQSCGAMSPCYVSVSCVSGVWAAVSSPEVYPFSYP